MNRKMSLLKQIAPRGLFLTIFSCLLLIAGSPALAQRPSPEKVVESALMESAFNGDLETVQQLVAAGISVSVRDLEERTPLMWSAFNGHTPVVSFLLDQGAEVDAQDNHNRTALMYASTGPFKETVDLLLINGADTNIQGTQEGFTALMNAAAEGELDVVRVLLINGANPELKDQDGDTAEDFAEQKGHTAVVSLLKNPPPQMGAKD
jgi:ankyrin repeat protein